MTKASTLDQRTTERWLRQVVARCVWLSGFEAPSKEHRNVRHTLRHLSLETSVPPGHPGEPCKGETTPTVAANWCASCRYVRQVWMPMHSSRPPPGWHTTAIAPQKDARYHTQHLENVQNATRGRAPLSVQCLHPHSVQDMSHHRKHVIFLPHATQTPRGRAKRQRQKVLTKRQTETEQTKASLVVAHQSGRNRAKLLQPTAVH